MRDPVLSNAVERRVVAKVTRVILPWLCLGWLIAYLDRFNVSFAALEMNQALALSPKSFGLGAGLFFIGYSVCEVPSNALLAKTGARWWLARIMVSWGAISMASAFVTGPRSFYASRLLLGVAEAGCFPGMVVYLSQWLPARHRPAALAVLGCASPVAAIIGGPLAGAILRWGGAFGLAGWQWVFLVEGLPAVVLGVALCRVLPQGPSSAHWMSAEEKAWVLRHSVSASALRVTRGDLSAVLRDRTCQLWTLVFFAFNCGSSALRLWQPLLLKAVSGQSPLAIGLMTAAPALAGVASILIVGASSARTNERRLHVAIPLGIGGIGLAAVGAAATAPMILFAAAIASVGVACQPPLFAAVSAVRGLNPSIAVAAVNSVAMTGAFVGPYVVGAIVQRTGNIGVACSVFGVAMLCGSATAAYGPLRWREKMPEPAPVV